MRCCTGPDVVVERSQHGCWYPNRDMYHFGSGCHTVYGTISGVHIVLDMAKAKVVWYPIPYILWYEWYIPCIWWVLGYPIPYLMQV